MKYFNPIIGFTSVRRIHRSWGTLTGQSGHRHSEHLGRVGWLLAVAFAAYTMLLPAAHAQPPPPPGTNPERDLQSLKAAYRLLDHDGQLTTIRISEAEARSNAIFDKAIAPVRTLPLSPADGEALKAAFDAIGKNDFANAKSLRGQIDNPVAQKLIDWGLLRRGEGAIESYQAFLAANPQWPNRWLLIEHLEAMMLQVSNPRVVLGYFSGREPETAAGEAALAAAYAASGQRNHAVKLASKAWRDGDIPDDYEDDILERIGSLLTHADHKWRLDRLLTDDFRWSSSRNTRAAVVRRQMKRVSEFEQAKAKARLSVFLRQNAAGKLLADLPEKAHTDWGVSFHRIMHLRRSGNKEEAAKLLLSAPITKSETVNPDAWWDERRLTAYAALDDDNPQLAYELVRDAGPLSVNPLKEQAFVAGWIALRYLGDAKAAIKHFRVMHEAADGPLSRAKSGYWLGRALEAVGDKAAARDYYKQAAEQFDTFHGQLAMQRLKPGIQALPIRPPQAPTSEQIARFQSNDAVHAAVIADKAGLGRSITRPFLANLGALADNEADAALVAHLMRALGDTQQSLRIGKRAIGAGMNLHYYAYPVQALPKYKPLRTPPETAFLFGIARQESEFNTQIVSGAGARGILQVMPVTAKHVCRDYRLKCEISRLGRDEAYNLMIASAYIGDRMGEFRGSYVLGLAGYNAGPGRARQWIRELGDPRAADLDPIDWVERIPFKETREYVAKVLSNIQVYRARLGAGDKALRLEEDLTRAQASGSRRKYAPGARRTRAAKDG
ncbi:soluble lytic murein transglycosylase [Filomicrobium insigne]|uniref:Soluble lytic murein transglycosylase n=1 Tax=Filomicrobium insigne TaxID=418854 RepID=A0A1H0R1E4_9HYPH|nr:lytic transglycosylase domain-containing protein [Filomicrobium insigne]SDP23240.1 soluble lytic murein transglycosylase [Filomicrobium insigne]